MPKKHLKKSLFPIPSPDALPESHELSNMTEDQKNAYDKAVREKSQKLVGELNWFLSKEGRAFEDSSLRSRGWEKKSEGWTKNGVRLMSREGFQLDREAYAMHQYFEDGLRLAVASRFVGPTFMDFLYIASRYGSSEAEWESYRSKMEGIGRPSVEAESFDDFDKALEKYKREKPNLKHFPAKEIIKRIPKKDGRPSDRTLTNRVIKWKNARGYG